MTLGFVDFLRVIENVVVVSFSLKIGSLCQVLYLWLQGVSMC